MPAESTATMAGTSRQRMMPGAPHAGRSFQPAPRPGESQAEFFVRAMRVLKRSIRSVNRRTIEVLRLWRRSANDQDLRNKARSQFPEATYQRFPPRCVFVEHTIPTSGDGRQPRRHYGREALRQMVDWANYRIRNSDTFSVIADGHTPTREELATGRPMPDVLGYAGPFYLGQLGDVNPRWAIYAEEWVHRADLLRFEKRQRRSPEVWVSEPIERRTMDPIAALGAETPRLDCGMNPYSRAGDGQTVMSYSAMTFGPGPGPGHPPRSFPFPVSNAPFGTHPNPGEFAMPLTSPVSTQVQAEAGAVDSRLLRRAVLQTVTTLLPSIVQTVQQQLDSRVPNDGTQADAPSADDETDLPLDELPDRELSAAESGEFDLEDVPDGELCQQYSAMSAACQRAFRAGWQRGATLSHRDSRGSDLHKVVARQQVRLQELSDQIARERRDTARYSKLTELSREFAFDPREEAETCRDLTDKQFERHCTATIVKYARRDDLTNVELFTDPTVRPDRVGGSARVNAEQIERYSREAAATAARKNAARRGSTTFEAEFDALCKQHGVTA